MYLSVFHIVLVFSHYAVSSYNLTCPAQSQRRFRNETFCTDPDKSNYICLLDVLKNENVESCFNGTFNLRKGRKKIRRPGITNADCTETRYQPIPFTTDEFSECMYSKSLCSEEGQVIANNGTNGYQDRTCRCDYRAGYTYIVEPRNKCECVPSEEDCSCYRKWCPPGEEVSKDYDCRVIEGIYITTCGAITGEQITNTGHVHTLSYAPENITDSSAMSLTSGWKAAARLIITLVLLALLLVVLLVDFRPHVAEMTVNMDENHIIYRDDKNHVYDVIEGCHLSVDCKIRSRIQVKSVKIVRLSSQMERSNIVVKSVYNEKNQLDQSRIKTGERKHLCPTDTGEHRCFLTNRMPLPFNNANTFCSKLARKQVLKYMTDFPPFSLETTNRIILNVHKLPSDFKIQTGYYGESLTFIASPESKRSILSIQWVRVVHPSPHLKLKPLTHDGTTIYSIENITMGDSGDYVCFMKTDDQTTSDNQPTTDDLTVLSRGFRLKVIPSASSYDKVIQHKKDVTYVDKAKKKSGIDKAMEKSAIDTAKKKSAIETAMEISGIDTAMEKLKNHKKVILKGREGTGKSKMCLEIASRCEDQHQYLPVMVTSKKDIKQEFDNNKVLYILDQSDDMDVDKFKELYILLLDRTMPPQAWTIIACRSLYGAEVGDETLLDCDSVLSSEEKEEILKVYMKKHNVDTATSADCTYKKKEILINQDIHVTLDQDAINKIITTEPLQGFPLMAKKFCKDRRKLHLGEKFFTNPPKEIVDRIIKLRENAIKGVDCELFLMFCLLVFLARENCINMKKIKTWYKNFAQVQTQLANIVYKFQSFRAYFNRKLEDSDEKKIKNAVNKMVGTYFKETDGVYEFIHPYLVKATFLSSQYFALHGLMDCPIEYILEFIRSCKYNTSEEEMVLKIDREFTYIHLLCERLVREITIHSERENEEDRVKDKVSEEDIEKLKLSDAVIAKEKLREEGIKDKKVNLYKKGIEVRRGKLCEENIENKKRGEEDKAKEKVKLSEKQAKVFKYIYNEWVKLGDEEFCRKLFNHIYAIFCIRDEGDIITLQAWHMLHLMNCVTSKGRDPWIYSIQDIPDMTVIFGLISACENKCSSNKQKRKTFEVLLETLGNRLSGSKEDLKKRSQSLVKFTLNEKSALQIDKYGNTLFHYLCLYSEDEACQIIDKYNAKICKELLQIKNKGNIQPIHLAVALGKPKILEKMQYVIGKEMKDDKETKSLLKQIMHNVKKEHIESKDETNSTAFDIDKNFDPEISGSVFKGSKEDFETVWKLFEEMKF